MQVPSAGTWALSMVLCTSEPQARSSFINQIPRVYGFWG